MQVQIGYPSAGVAWSARPDRRYSNVGRGVGVVRGGFQDITGKQGAEGAGAGRVVHDALDKVFGPVTLHTSVGRGARVLRRAVGKFKRGARKGQTKFAVVERQSARRGRVLGRRARSVGVGADVETARARAIEDWLSPMVPCSDKPDTERAAVRARILSEIGAAHDLGERLLAIGRRAAARQARRVVELRGVRPSDTSVEDAAADAVAGVLSSVRRLDKSTAHWQSARFVRVVAMYAGRAAFKSLCSWSRVGMTGDNTCSGSWAGVVTDALDTLRAESPDYSEDTHSQAGARRAFVRWVYSVGLRGFTAALPHDMRGTARASAIAGARRRCRVVASVILGADMASAILHGGFNSADAFVASCKSAGFWRGLRDARARALCDVPCIATARGWQRAHAIDAGDTARTLARMCGAGDEFNGVSSWGARGLRGRRAVVESLSESVRWAQFFKRQAARLTREHLRAFDSIVDKLRRGAFADLSGVAMPRRRRGVQSALIGRARGKVARARRLARTVPVQVETRYGARKLACAPSAGNVQPWATMGAGGFAVVTR